jgi:hypothetical protein
VGDNLAAPVLFRLLFTGSLLFFSTSLRAQQASAPDSRTQAPIAPISLDELLASKQNTRLQYSFSFGVNESPALVSVERGVMVSSVETRFASAGLTLLYGLSGDLNLSLSGRCNFANSVITDDISSNISGRVFGGALAGISWRAYNSKENKTSIVLNLNTGFSQPKSISSHGNGLTSINFGGTFFKVSDPVSFSLSIGHFYTRPLEMGGFSYSALHTTSLSGDVSFFPNDRVGLTAGTSFSFNNAGRVNGTQLQSSTMSSMLFLGGSYYFSTHNNTLNFGVQTATSGGRGSTFTTSVLTAF